MQSPANISNFGSQLPLVSLLATAVLSAAAQPAAADAVAEGAGSPASPVVVIVRIPKPWYAPKSVVTGKMRDAIPEYAKLPGLAFKAFSFERASGDYGGIYYWRDRASAQAWFNPAWFERVKRERGNDANVRILDAPVSLDNTPGGTTASTDSAAVATLVEITIPKGVTRERLSAELIAAVPQYQEAPGLLRKHFTISDPGTFGGLYLWKDEASAKAWFNNAWHERVTRTYGQDATIEWFDTPILLPTQDGNNSIPRTTMIVAAP